MSALWTPESARSKPAPMVSREHDATTREWEQRVLSLMKTTGGVIDYWNPVLKAIDRNLRLMQASFMSPSDIPGVRAGFYHLVRLRDPALATFMWVNPIQGPHGEFIEPNSAMLDVLRASDLQNPAAVRDRLARDRRDEASKARAQQREDEDRLDEGVARWQAATRTQILTSRDVPWSQNNSATARRDRGERK